MTELELLQQKHQEEAARRRAKVIERKRRTRRLIERGAILENTLDKIQSADIFTNDQVQKIVDFAILDPNTIAFIEREIGE